MPLVVFGLFISVGYWGVRTRVVPMIEENLRDKAKSSSTALATELDVALGADDMAMVQKTVAPILADPDFRAVEVRDAKDVVRYKRGEVTGGVSASHAVSIEGVQLGSVLVVYDTARVDQLERWVGILGTITFVFWLASLIYAVTFSRAFVRPIRAMMDFARDVAGGKLGAKVSTAAPGELAELAEHLDQMSAELAERQAEQKRAAAKEAELRSELMQVSRMAGMAEVATGVLHNVGNVLNSLNVSVSVVGDRLRQSKVASLTKTVEMFGAHPDGLPGLLTTEKGKLIPQFLTSVAQRLVEENALVRTELESVATNVDHIKAIVATQQSYAQVAGVAEPVELPSVLDDALQLSEASFTRHKVELIKRYGDVPTLNTDRHKLLQIVINLISNARHALKSKGQGGDLTVTIERRDDQVAIVVADNGIGISPENLSRVFQHGFTTKKGGHGFGLHSCANAARELGGSIKAESAGTNLGATFTLMLPISRTNDLRN